METRLLLPKSFITLLNYYGRILTLLLLTSVQSQMHMVSKQYLMSLYVRIWGTQKRMEWTVPDPWVAHQDLLGNRHIHEHSRGREKRKQGRKTISWQFTVSSHNMDSRTSRNPPMCFWCCKSLNNSKYVGFQMKRERTGHLFHHGRILSVLPGQD